MLKRLILNVSLLLLCAVELPAVTQTRLETPELIVVYDDGLEQTAQHVSALYAGVRQELQTLFQWPVVFRPTLVLINDRQKFQNLSGHPLVVAYALPHKNVMVIDNSRMATRPFNLRAIIKHELSHLILHQYISSGRLPRWLDEGVSQWASDGLADIILDSRKPLLPAAILSDRYFNLASLRRSFPAQKDALILAYEQSKSVVEYISRTYGAQGVLDLLDLLRQGHELESAVEIRFGVSLDQLEEQWRKHLKNTTGWFTYLSIHLYEILFVSAALLTVLAFIRRVMRKKAYVDEDDTLDDI